MLDMAVLDTANADMRETSQPEQSTWYTGVELEWRTPPSTNSSSGSRKRSWEETASPVNPPLDSQRFEEIPWSSDLDLLDSIDLPHDFITPATSSNGGQSSTNGLEGARRTRMQTGCIPCLYADQRM